MERILDLFELIKIIILSIVQGITEWLPISSTGHMILIEDIMPLHVSADFWSMFLVLVQLGSIFAVVVLYFNKLNPFSSTKSSVDKKDTWILWLKVAIASVPAVIFGFILDDYMEEYFNKPLIIAFALIIYGIGFIWIENRDRGKHAREIVTLNELTFADAVKIGLFQALAIIPGTSRSGSTIMGGLLVDANRFVATEFSFFMGIPIMFGASALKLVKFGFHFTVAELIYLLVGMAVAFIVSIVVIRFLISYLQRHDFTAFGYYRIVLGVIVILYTLFVK